MRGEAIDCLEVKGIPALDISVSVEDEDIIAN